MKQQKTKFSKRINATIVLAILLFAGLFTFGLRATALAIEQADAKYNNDLKQAIIERQKETDKNNSASALDPSFDEIEVYDNFYDLADAVARREEQAESYKYYASGDLRATACISGVSVGLNEAFSYSRNYDKRGNKLLTFNGAGEELFGFSLTFNNTYYYNASTGKYRFLQYFDPTVETDAAGFNNQFYNVDIRKNMFTVTSETIESVEEFYYNEETETYHVKATIDSTDGTYNIRTFVAGILGGNFSSSSSHLSVVMEIRKDFVIKHAEYDSSIRMSMSGNGLDGYVDLNGVMTENLLSFGEVVTIRPSI